MTTNVNKREYLICGYKKCSTEGAALLKLEQTFVKEVKSLDNSRQSGKISKAQLAHQLKHIGEASGVKKAAERFTKCIESKCAKEKKASDKSKKS